MYSIISDFLRIKSFVTQFLDKHKVADDRKQYTHAVRLFQNTLQETSAKLEDIYYQYILRPQIHVIHGVARNHVVHMASLLVLFYITGWHQARAFVVGPALPELEPDT